MTARRFAGDRPVFRQWSIACFLLLVPFAAHALWDYVEMRRLASAIDDLRERGEPVSSSAARREWPPDEDARKAARYYSAAAELAFRDWLTDHPVANLPRGEALRLARQDLATVGRNRTVALDAAQRFRGLVEEYSEALAIADRAADLPFAGFPPHSFDNYPRTYSLEDLTLPASARTLLAVAAGDAPGAGESLYRSVRLRRALTRSVPWIGLPFSDLQMLLENAPPSSEMLAKLQGAFAERERPDSVEQGLRAQRATLIEAAWGELYGRGADPMIPSANIHIGWNPWQPLRPWIAREVRLGLAEQDQVLSAAVQPWPDKLAALERLEPGDQAPRRRRPDIRWFSRNLASIYARDVVPAEAAALAETRAAQVVLAGFRHWRDRHSMPLTLEALVPAYLPSVPEDPFTGRPLLYSRDKSRIVVYSAGHDGKDDAGDVGPVLPAARSRTSKDVGIEIRLTDAGT